MKEDGGAQKGAGECYNMHMNGWEAISCKVYRDKKKKLLTYQGYQLWARVMKGRFILTSEIVGQRLRSAL